MEQDTIIILHLAFCFGILCGGFFVYIVHIQKHLTESEYAHIIFEEQGKHEPLEKYMERVGRPISETFPEYLERVGAIKPKFELSEELKDKYGSFGDIPKPTRHTDEKEILDKFDIDIAKTCEEAENEIKKAEAFWLSKSDKTITIKRPSHETFPLDKNGNGGC